MNFTFPMNASELIPQKAPFQFIDELLEVSEQKTISQFVIKQNTSLVENEKLSENALLEIMAQTAAASSGFVHQMKNEAIPNGFIGAIKHIVINQIAKIGDVLKTEIVPKNSIGNASIVEGKIFLENNLIASCELTIFVSN